MNTDKEKVEFKALLLQLNDDKLDWYQEKEEELLKKTRKRRIQVMTVSLAAVLVLGLLGFVYVKLLKPKTPAHNTESSESEESESESIMDNNNIQKVLNLIQKERWFDELFHDKAEEPITIVAESFSEKTCYCFLIPGRQQYVYGPDMHRDYVLSSEEILGILDHFQVKDSRVTVRYFQNPVSSYIPSEEEKREYLLNCFGSRYEILEDIKPYWDDSDHFYGVTDSDEQLYFNGEYYSFMGEGKGSEFFKNIIPLSGFCKNSFENNEVVEGIYWIETEEEKAPVIIRWRDDGEVAINPINMSYTFRYSLKPGWVDEKTEQRYNELHEILDTISAELYREKETYLVRFKDESELHYFVNARQTGSDIDYDKVPLQRDLEKEEIEKIIPEGVIPSGSVKAFFDPETKKLCRIRFETEASAYDGSTHVDIGNAYVDVKDDLPSVEPSYIHGIPVRGACRTVYKEHTLPDYFLALFTMDGWEANVKTTYMMEDKHTPWAENAFIVYRLIMKGTEAFSEIGY